MYLLNYLIVYRIVLFKFFISMSKGIIIIVYFGDFCYKMEKCVFIIVILLVVISGVCVGDNKEIEILFQDLGGEFKGWWLLLNDLNILLKEIEVLYREMMLLKFYVIIMEMEVVFLNLLKIEVSI